MGYSCDFMGLDRDLMGLSGDFAGYYIYLIVYIYIYCSRDFMGNSTINGHFQ